MRCHDNNSIINHTYHPTDKHFLITQKNDNYFWSATSPSNYAPLVKILQARRHPRITCFVFYGQHCLGDLNRKSFVFTFSRFVFLFDLMFEALTSDMKGVSSIRLVFKNMTKNNCLRHFCHPSIWPDDHQLF